jgi:hypothetical protein
MILMGSFDSSFLIEKTGQDAYMYAGACEAVMFYADFTCLPGCY